MSEIKPPISVIIPVYNSERYLPETLESVLEQTCPPTEILVIDDGSTDGTAAIARQFEAHVTLISQENQGAGTARNRGVEVAAGEYIAFLDADDVWVDKKLELQLLALRQQPQVNMAFGHVSQFISPDIDDQLKATMACPGKPIAGYCPGTMLIKRETFLQVGFFEIHLEMGEFIDWYAKAIEKGLNGIMLPDIVLKRRLHGTNLTIRERDAQHAYARVLKASLDRRRKAIGS